MASIYDSINPTYNQQIATMTNPNDILAMLGNTTGVSQQNATGTPSQMQPPVSPKDLADAQLKMMKAMEITKSMEAEARKQQAEQVRQAQKEANKGTLIDNSAQIASMFGNMAQQQAPIPQTPQQTGSIMDLLGGAGDIATGISNATIPFDAQGNPTPWFNFLRVLAHSEAPSASAVMENQVAQKQLEQKNTLATQQKLQELLNKQTSDAGIEDKKFEQQKQLEGLKFDNNLKLQNDKNDLAWKVATAKLENAKNKGETLSLNQKRLEESKLRSETDKTLKDFSTLQNSYINLKNYYEGKGTPSTLKLDDGKEIKLKTQNGISDMAILYTFIKALDPNSVVREGEVKFAQEATSYLERLGLKVTKLTKGIMLTPAQRDAIMAETQRRYEAFKPVAVDALDRALETINRYDLDKDAVIQKRYMNIYDNQKSNNTQSNPTSGVTKSGISYKVEN